ncbi:MAG: methylated-DNA--[protein]-cysteine S-methyltransferase [Acidobacteriota bacterium]
MTLINRTIYESVIGPLEVRGSDNGIRSIRFLKNADSSEDGSVPAVLTECVQQLGEYFRGERTEFTFQLDESGTTFQKMVWGALRKIPFGETRSYKDVGEEISNPGAVRAVGGANNRNDIVIAVPCHRVIGTGGRLVGFGGGLWRKKWLLEHERQIRKAQTG